MGRASLLVVALDGRLASDYRTWVRDRAGKEASMSSTVINPETRRRAGVLAWLAESFWIADVMVVAMFAFFIALGAFNPFETGAIAIALTVLLGLYGVHLWVLHRRREELQRSPESRRARERRGF
jgi:hypothetical protein